MNDSQPEVKTDVAAFKLRTASATEGAPREKTAQPMVASNEQFEITGESISVMKFPLESPHPTATKGLRLLQLVGALVVAGFIGMAVIPVVVMEHMWGFNLVQKLLGKQDSLQWIFSAALTGFCAQTVAGLTFGYLKAHFRGSFRWIVAAIIVQLSALIVVFDVHSFSLDPEELIVPVAIALSLISFFFGSSFGEQIVRALMKRTTPAQLLVPGIVALLCQAAVGYGSHGWRLTFFLDATFIFAGAVTAGVLCRRREFSSKLVASSLTSLPFIICNLLNLSLNVVLLSLPLLLGLRENLDDSSRACMSSLAITLVCLSGTAGGAYMAYLLQARQERLTLTRL